MDAPDDPRVVLVHDWLNGMRGGEKCLEVLCRRWPRAPLFTLLHRPGAVSAVIEDRAIHTSWLQRLPGVHRHYRYALPLMPWASRSWRLPASDLVISLSHCVAKGVTPPPGTPHVCYCFTPMRYAWHMRDAYFGTGRRASLKSRFSHRILARLRDWDRRTAAGVSHFVAISRTVQARVAECYGRESTIIYPPVDTAYYVPDGGPRENYYLAVSAFAPYKRLDLAITACNRLGRRLKIIGNGQEEAKLRRLAGPTVEFLGWQPAALVREHYRRCRALLFPGEEDFGIVPVEAQACGTPVIAFGRGGATETVIPRGGDEEPTGLWFAEQDGACLSAAIEAFELCAADFSSRAARCQAERFNEHRFAEEFFGFIGRLLDRGQIPARRAA